MADITITDDHLQGLGGKIVLLTGGSSGIGLATTSLLLNLGAKVVNGDLQPPNQDLGPAHHFVKTDVTNWADLKALFKQAIDLHGRVDHVFANAGMRPTEFYVDLSLDEAGEPLEPTHRTIDVNLKGVINTAALALHYMQKHGGECSIVLTTSDSCFSRFHAADYAIAKHGVLGLMRGLHATTYPHLPIRVNALAPSWTITGLVPEEVYVGTGANLQGAEAPARAAVYLMADKERHGQMILSVGGKYREIEEAILQRVMTAEVRGQEKDEDEILRGVVANLQKNGGM